MNGYYPIKINNILCNDNILCLICYNYKLSNDIAYIFYNKLQNVIDEVILFTRDEKQYFDNQYYFFSQFDFQVSKQLQESIYLYKDDVIAKCKTINLYELSQKFNQLIFDKMSDTLNITFRYGNIEVYSQYPPKIIHDGTYFERFKNMLKEMILLCDETILLDNLCIGNIFNSQTSKYSYTEAYGKYKKYLRTINLPQFPSIEKLNVPELKKLIALYSVMIGKFPANSYTLDFLKIRLFTNITITIFNTDIAINARNDSSIIYLIQDDPKLTYIFNFIMNNPKYDDHKTKLELDILTK